MSSYYLTTPIYYINDKPHIGHAYATILADVIARRRKLMGDRVRFLTGTDEHGEKVARAAAERGLTPQQQVDELAPIWKATWDRLEIRYDRFIRTTEPDHIAVVRAALEALRAGSTPAGEPLLYESAYTGWYCVSDERYWTEKDLVEGRCPDCGKQVEEIEERNYFFRMSAFQQDLIDHITKNPSFIYPETRKNEILGFLREPLEDLCVSRPRERLQWGVPFPWDEEYVTYVWVDALLNYVTGRIDPSGDPEADALRAIETWNDHPADLHVIGKDILTTHSVYWITLLMALGWALPRQILAHGWWVWGGEKMSKSVGNVVSPDDLVDTLGVDGMRYYLLREMTLGQDSAYSYDSLVQRLNADLANDMGNLHSRVTKMISRYLGGRLPSRKVALDTAEDEASPIRQASIQLREQAETLLDGGASGGEGSAAAAWDDWRINVALERVMRLFSSTNRYLEETAPWKRVKEPGSEPCVEATLYYAAEAVRLGSALLWPVVPEISARALETLGQTTPPTTADLGWGVLDGDEILTGEGLYQRLEIEVAAEDGTSS